MYSATRVYFSTKCIINVGTCSGVLFLGTVCWNPAFDVTPAELITGGIVTEFGVFPPKLLKQSLQEAKNKAH